MALMLAGGMHTYAIFAAYSGQAVGVKWLRYTSTPSLTMLL